MALFINPSEIGTMNTKSSMKSSLETKLLDNNETKFLTELISNIIEIDIDKNFDTKVDNMFKNLKKEHGNVIQSTKDKLDTLIKKYHMSGLENLLEKILSEPEFNKGIKYIMEKKQNSIKDTQKSIKNKSNSIKDTQKSIKNIMKGGGKAEANRRIVDAILYGVNNSHQVTIMDQVKICQSLLFITLILLLLKLMIHILFINVQGIDHPSNIYLKRCLVAFMKLWYNIVGRTIVQIDNPVVEIDLPYDSVSEFDYFDHDPYAWLGRSQNLSTRGTPALAQDVPENAEDEIMQKIEYFKTVQSDRKYKIKYLFNKNNNVIRESIRKLERELNNLLQPEHVLTNVEYVDRGAVSRTSIFNNKRFSQAVPINETNTTIDPHAEATAPDEEIDHDTTEPHQNASAPYEDDIVMASVESGLVPMGEQTKHILLIFIESCLEYLSRNNTITGGTLKTRRNKKRIARTKKSKRNSRSA
jgi:hypothetical protein